MLSLRYNELRVDGSLYYQEIPKARYKYIVEDEVVIGDSFVIRLRKVRYKSKKKKKVISS